VEWKAVSEIFHLKNGYTPSKSNSKYWQDGTIPWFRMEDIRANGRILDDSLQKISISAVKGGKLFPSNSIIIATSATIGEHALITVPYLANQRFTCLILKSGYVGILNIKFLFYYCFFLANWCKKNTTMSSFASVDMDGFRKFRIPVPYPDNSKKSLEVQSEIVRILDVFTELTAELTAELAVELTARKEQHNYYRNHLLSFEDGEVEWKTLGDIGDVKMCKRILKNETQSEGDVPFYKIGTFGKKANAFISREIFESYKSRYSFPKKGDVLISASGTIGRAVVYDGEPAYFQDSNIVWLDNDESIVTNKYLWHFYKIAKWFVSEGGTIDRLYNDNIKKTKIIVPYPKDSKKSLSEQARIVAILDKFDALTNSISEGLPREIELRQKQYEYYRDMLFNFPKPKEAAE